MSYHDYKAIRELHEFVLAGDLPYLGAIKAKVLRNHPYGNHPASLVTVHERHGRYWVAHQTLDHRLLGVCPRCFRTLQMALSVAHAQSTALPHIKELFAR